MKKNLLLVAFTLVAFATHAQLSWPTITSQTKPWTRWWWQGSAVDKENLSAVMKLYQQAGLGGLEITPIYGVKGEENKFIDFLSPKWVEMLQYTLAEAKKLNLGIDMATGTGWPFGGPWVTETDAAKYMVSKTYAVKAGEQLDDEIFYQQDAFVRTANGKALKVEDLARPVSANKNMQALAIDQVRYNEKLPLQIIMAYDDKGNAIDLTSCVKNGKLDWTAPKDQGKWKLIALFEGIHGKMVERAAPGGEGNVIDHFNKKALTNYLSKFDKAFAGKDITSLRSFFNDSYEVDDARGESNWTPAFFEEFIIRRGYDLRKELPALLANDKSDHHQQVLYDYRETISDLLLEKFTQPWHSWAKAKGKLIRNQSHGSPANILDLYATIDIPETEGANLTRFKFATSSAHVMGKPLASAEAATWQNEHFLTTLSDVKTLLDQYFIGGVNHIFYHGTNYSPVKAEWPGWLFYAAVHFTPANSFWKDFDALNGYVARSQSFLQAGKPSNDVLLYFPFADRNYDPPSNKGLLHHFDGMEGFENTSFDAAAEQMLEMGYGWDLISDRQIQQLKVVGKKLQAPGGEYDAIVLSGVKHLPIATLEKLLGLVKQGATIIFHDGVPEITPGFDITGTRQPQYDQLVQQIIFGKSQAAGVDVANLGKGFCWKGKELRYLLANANVRNEEFLADKHLQFIRRKINGGEYYFIVNNSKKPFNDWVLLNTKLQQAYLFDPMMQRAGVAKTRKGDNETLDILLQLAPGESCVVQTTQVKPIATSFPYTEIGKEEIELRDRWEFSVQTHVSSEEKKIELEKLGSWTTLPVDGIDAFSGSATYTTHFEKPSGNATAWLIDLGEVKESAEVFINGKKISTLIGPSYKVIIPTAPLQNDNELKVVVTNGMANRIIKVDKDGVEWKKFYNINMPARLPANRGSDGLFTPSKWSPLPSGLLGPVTLQPVTYIK